MHWLTRIHVHTLQNLISRAIIFITCCTKTYQKLLVCIMLNYEITTYDTWGFMKFKFRHPPWNVAVRGHSRWTHWSVCLCEASVHGAVCKETLFPLMDCQARRDCSHVFSGFFNLKEQGNSCSQLMKVKKKCNVVGVTALIVSP